MLISWVDFYLFIFWFLFIGFLISFTNVLNLLILGEIFWVIFSSYLIFLSSFLDFYFLFFISMYLFVFATSETSIGLVLVMLKNSFNSSVSINNFFFKNFFFLRKNITKNIYSKLEW